MSFASALLLAVACTSSALDAPPSDPSTEPDALWIEPLGEPLGVTDPGERVDETGTDGWDTGDTEPPLDLELEATLAPEMPTVVRMTWSEDYPATVLYDTGSGVYRTEGQLSGDRHEAWLVGAAAEQDIDLVLVGEADDGVFETGTLRVRNGALTVEALDLSSFVDASDEMAPGLLLMSWVSDGSLAGWPASASMVSLVDRDGRTVWSWPPRRAPRHTPHAGATAESGSCSRSQVARPGSSSSARRARSRRPSGLLAPTTT